MKSIFLTVALVLFTSVVVNAYPLVPNPEWAQGSLCTRKNSDYETDRYAQKIPYCRRNVATSLKTELYDLYKIPEKCRGSYTIDHIIPLSIGGDNSAQNLWPEHRNVKATRAQLEEELFIEVRENHMTQKEAVETILNIKRTQVRPKNGSTDCDRL